MTEATRPLLFRVRVVFAFRRAWPVNLLVILVWPMNREFKSLFLLAELNLKQVPVVAAVSCFEVVLGRPDTPGRLSDVCQLFGIALKLGPGPGWVVQC